MCRKSMPGYTWVYWVLSLLKMACLLIALAMQKPFLVCFQSVRYDRQFSNWQSMIVLLIKTKKKSTVMCFCSSHSPYGLPIYPRIRKPDSALDWKRSHLKLSTMPFYFSAGLLWCTQIATAKITLAIMERHSVQWLPYYIKWDFQWRKIVNVHQDSSDKVTEQFCGFSYFYS
jgi:hypothetical protein